MIMNHFLWLLPLIFPHLSSPVILLERSDGNLLHNRNGMMEEDKTVLHRFRRDWMWRQFFLSEEYMGSNYQYVGKVRDCDNLHCTVASKWSTLSYKTALGEDARNGNCIIFVFRFHFPELYALWHCIWTRRCVAGTWKNSTPSSKQIK